MNRNHGPIRWNWFKNGPYILCFEAQRPDRISVIIAQLPTEISCNIITEKIYRQTVQFFGLTLNNTITVGLLCSWHQHLRLPNLSWSDLFCQFPGQNIESNRQKIHKKMFLHSSTIFCCFYLNRVVTIPALKHLSPNVANATVWWSEYVESWEELLKALRCNIRGAKLKLAVRLAFKKT